jgi:predicted lysophospholipase L1 biosynthesis ABC-type transport system permease subunit
LRLEDAVLDELKHSLRSLRRSPLSSLSAIAILAVAIGASAAVFAVVDKVLIRRLPLEDPRINDPRYDIYLPDAQIPGMRVKHLMVRTTVDAASLSSSIRAEARRLDSSVLVENAVVMSSFVERVTSPWRFSAWTLGLLGLIALGLATFGVFATLSQSVVERTREIGIRVAVGALPHQVSALVFREVVALTVVGMFLGSAAAALTGGYLERLLFDVPAIDAATLAGMALLFSVVSAIAVYVPAWRASRLDPIVALRRQ